MNPIRKILVPIDFEDASIRAVDDAIDLAAALGASIVLMHAYEPAVVPLFPDAPLASPAQDVARLEESTRVALRTLAETKRHRGVPLEIVVCEGVPWRRIDEVADHVGADLIVMGTHGQHGVLRALLGSVAERVVRTAHQPVLTIPAAAPAR